MIPSISDKFHMQFRNLHSETERDKILAFFEAFMDERLELKLKDYLQGIPG